MSPKKPFEPNFNTPEDLLCKEEVNKLNSNGGRGNLADDFRNEQDDIAWETEQLAKSQGIYLEFNRAIKAPEKHWMYMIRIANPGGGPISREQWNAYHDMGQKYTTDPDGNTSLRFTNRQTIQFHWLKKPGVLDIVKTMAEVGHNSLNGCGDNTRNVMACPLSRFSNDFNANAWAHKAGEYFQLPIEPFIEIFNIDPTKVRKPGESFQYGPKLLNRKFKIAFSTVHRDENGNLVKDNCIEMRTHDMGVAPVIENNEIKAYQIYVGGGQGERNGKPSQAMLSTPLCVVDEENLLKVMDAVVQAHQKIGDRQNRHWARLKYVIKKQGIDWFREQVSSVLGAPLEKPIEDYDIGARDLHFGWTKQPSNGLWTYGAYIECGRVTDASPNGKIMSMIHHVMNKYDIELSISANQDALFSNIPEEQKEEFEADLKSFGYGERNGKPISNLRLRSGACVGRDTCRLTYTDSEKFEPVLLDKLDEMGWGDVKESIGITGCERQCFRPGTKSICLVGSGLNRYQFKLMASEDGRHQGQPIIDGSGENIYLRSVDREEVPVVIDALFKFWKDNAEDGEDLGAYHRRIGFDAIIAHLKENAATAALLEKPFNTSCIID